MLRQGNKIFAILCLVISFTACNRYKEYNAKEIAGIRNRILKTSQHIIGQDEYWAVYNLANDSINNWISNNLSSISYLNNSKWILDSLLCFNVLKDKCIMCYMTQDKLGPMDDIHYFYGVKINENWYFFKGAVIYLPREYYQKDIHTPLSFEKLKQIATYNIYRRYLIKNKQGDWEINERFFEGMANKNMVAEGYGSCFDCKTEEEYYLYLVRRNWENK